MDTSLQEVLAAREVRWQHRQALTVKSQCPVVSVTLCVPQKFRTSQDFYTLFRQLCGKLVQALTAQGVTLVERGELTGADGPAQFYTAETDALALKGLCVQLEESLPGGRMLDIDLMDAKGHPVGRSTIGLGGRRCFLCEEEAALCVSRRLHTPAEIEQQVRRLYDEAMAQLQAFTL